MPTRRPACAHARGSTPASNSGLSPSHAPARSVTPPEESSGGGDGGDSGRSEEDSSPDSPRGGSGGQGSDAQEASGPSAAGSAGEEPTTSSAAPAARGQPSGLDPEALLDTLMATKFILG
eukprot:scaffold318488_cov36-Tisochrysis_lutea.AAC.1